MGRTEKYLNGKKKKGSRKVGENGKYRNGKKKKGSRKVEENGEVTEWCGERRSIRMVRKRKGAGEVGRTETIQNGPVVQTFVQIKL